MAKQWYMPFDVGKWKKDLELSSCSMGARGIWLELLLLMWESSERGYLMTASKGPMSLEQITRAVRSASIKEVRELLEELRLAGVSSIDARDIIYCRGMVREAAQSTRKSEAANKRWSRPASGSAYAEGHTEQMQLLNVRKTSELESDLTAAAHAPSQWPLAAAAICERFPTADADMCRQIAAAAQSTYPPIEDYQLADAVKAAHKRDQRSAALFLKTVPGVISNWRKQVDADADRRAAADAYNQRLTEQYEAETREPGAS